MIDIKKTYLTRQKKFPVRILCMDRKLHGELHNNHPVVVLIDMNGSEELATYDLSGSYYGPGTKSDLDLIECNPADDLVLDQVIWVRNDEDGNIWYPRHFSHFEQESGYVHTFINGWSFKTNTSDFTKGWKYFSKTQPEQTS